MRSGCGFQLWIAGEEDYREIFVQVVCLMSERGLWSSEQLRPMCDCQFDGGYYAGYTTAADCVVSTATFAQTWGATWCR